MRGRRRAYVCMRDKCKAAGGTNGGVPRRIFLTPDEDDPPRGVRECPDCGQPMDRQTNRKYNGAAVPR